MKSAKLKASAKNNTVKDLGKYRRLPRRSMSKCSVNKTSTEHLLIDTLSVDELALHQAKVERIELAVLIEIRRSPVRQMRIRHSFVVPVHVSFMSVMIQS